ncbi:MAG: nucleoside diphosphate kinase regulator [Pseudonocardiales bacterium]|nr:GreA/GreB family elongation factor [Actinomycetota bacterium]PZS15618.1 MAG: nucleoside diphosphate kinase regulator [Pseudonocardiales bacterium]
MVTRGQAAEYSSQAGATAVERLEQELVALNSRRRELAEGLSDRDSAGDRADAAGVLEQSEDLSWVDERIAQVTEQIGQLRDGTVTGGDDELADGTVVTLRFADGTTRTMRAVAITEEIMEGEESTAMTLGSPLARALVGSSAGDTIIYRSPSGEEHAEVIAIEAPASRA